ncbi:MAG: hypothetical protein ACW987_12960 [Candidatus Thorarchaeota archaeon]
MPTHAEFQDKFDLINRGTLFLDNLQASLSDTVYLDKIPPDQLPSLASIYTDKELSAWTKLLNHLGIPNGFTSVLAGQSDAEIEFDELINKLTGLDDSTLDFPEPEMSRDEWIEFLLTAKCFFYDMICMQNYGCTISELYENAKSGSNSAFLDLVRIDKTVIFEEWAKIQIQGWQLRGEWEHFNNLGKAIAKEPAKPMPTYLRLIYTVKMFWDSEFKNWTIEQLNEFLIEKDLLPHTFDPRTLQRILHREDIKKYSR